MKKIYYPVFILLSICFLFFSCREGIVEPVRLLEIAVYDTLGVPIQNAKVQFYFTEQDLNRNTSQIIETLYTNEKGVINVALDIEIFDYYVNVEKDELNNWYTNTFVSLPNVTKKNTVAIILTNSFQSKLTGKYKRRWQQTDNIINGNPSFPNCNNQLYHDFIRRIETEKNKRDGEVEKYQTNICPFPGTSEGVNQWAYNKQNNTITFGIENFEEVYKITEFTNDKISLVYTTPDGFFVIERKYKLIE